ncbi:hypothetical protein HY501_01785, partial [Candidatus Woesearchaeota archaeon]|nr:hypothetical protein [Candidatus Woesearchaeota archaeon]
PMGISDACFGTNVLELSSLSDSDAHAGRPGVGDFGNKICCTGVADLTVNFFTGGGPTSGDAFFLELTSEYDGHASVEEGVWGYDTSLFLDSASDTITCGVVDSGVNTCAGAGYETCVVALSDTYDAHVSDCSYTATFEQQVCCSSSGVLGADCQVTDVFWTDGIQPDLPSTIQDTVIGLVLLATGDCSAATADFSVYKANDALINDTIELDNTPFATYLDGGVQIWYTVGEWRAPNGDGAFVDGDQYYFKADVNDAVAPYQVDNKGSEVTVFAGCPVPPFPPLNCPTASCTICDLVNDPLCLDPLFLQGQDQDCDGIDDCVDQCVGMSCTDDGFFDYQPSQVDPCTGIPVGLPGCSAYWDCTPAAWSECFRDNNGDLIATRDIGLCTFNGPGPDQFCSLPADKKTCIEEEEFPFFTNMNLIVVSLLLAGFYLYRRREYF